MLAESMLGGGGGCGGDSMRSLFTMKTFGLDLSRYGSLDLGIAGTLAAVITVWYVIVTRTPRAKAMIPALGELLDAMLAKLVQHAGHEVFPVTQ